ncbi:hypothetical protein H9Q73_013612 [Fusarium xylarioides]|nr:hypothetical protein H9Q73_013612 [Fusarium xylarioides]
MDLSPLAALQSVHERRKAACRVFNSRIPLSSPQPPRFFSLKFAQWETLARYSCLFRFRDCLIISTSSAHLPDVWLALESISSLNGPLSSPFSF